MASSYQPYLHKCKNEWIFEDLLGTRARNLFVIQNINNESNVINIAYIYIVGVELSIYEYILQVIISFHSDMLILFMLKSVPSAHSPILHPRKYLSAFNNVLSHFTLFLTSCRHVVSSIYLCSELSDGALELLIRDLFESKQNKNWNFSWIFFHQIWQ